MAFRRWRSRVVPALVFELSPPGLAAVG